MYQIQKDYTVSQRPLIRTDKDVDRRVSTGKNTRGRQKPERYTSFSAEERSSGPLGVRTTSVAPTAGGEGPVAEGFSVHGKENGTCC